LPPRKWSFVRLVGISVTIFPNRKSHASGNFWAISPSFAVLQGDAGGSAFFGGFF
jgi:hypothetical protein